MNREDVVREIWKNVDEKYKYVFYNPSTDKIWLATRGYRVGKKEIWFDLDSGRGCIRRSLKTLAAEFEYVGKR